MQGRLWNVLERSSVVAFAALGLSLTDCSGNAFKGQADASGAGGAQAGSGGAAAGTPEAGRAGSEGSNDQAGRPGVAGGSAGTVGTPGSGCNCESGFYCRDASPDCLSCASPDRLKFTAPERIAPLSDSGHGSRFPRIGATSTDLLYR